jgi:glucose-6-phosphate 1-epimerase
MEGAISALPIACFFVFRFARNVNWELAQLNPLDHSVTLRLAPSDYSRKMWDENFEATLTTKLTGESLETEMRVTNKGRTAFDFQAALHSYFDVSDISKVSVGGSFAGKKFLNKMRKPAAEEVETRSELTVGEEYDRVYHGVNDCVLKDAGKGRALQIVNDGGWKDTVVWSPYGNEGMGYKTFLCVESAAVAPVTLKGGCTWTATLALVPAAL